MIGGGTSEERRKQRRDLITLPISYSYASLNDSGTYKSLTTNGITLNISDSGMCFYTHVRLDEGLPVNVSSRAIWDTQKKGVIKWCRKITEELYRVGLSLLQ